MEPHVLYEEQRRVNSQRESATENLKKRLSNELNQNNNGSVYDEYNK